MAGRHADERDLAYVDACMTSGQYRIGIGEQQTAPGYWANINTPDGRWAVITVDESYASLIGKVAQALRERRRPIRTVAASSDFDGHVTPGARYERDEDGVLWRTPFGMQGEALGPTVRVEELS